MTILQLKYVIAIDEECSMRKAADRLYVSQPGLSSAVRDLENELGIQIFQRVHNGVVTTVAGGAFIAYARSAVEQFEKIEDKYINKQGFTEVLKTNNLNSKNCYYEVVLR